MLNKMARTNENNKSLMDMLKGINNAAQVEYLSRFKGSIMNLSNVDGLEGAGLTVTQSISQA